VARASRPSAHSSSQPNGPNARSVNQRAARISNGPGGFLFWFLNLGEVMNLSFIHLPRESVLQKIPRRQASGLL
jgi:hypothetical protein